MQNFWTPVSDNLKLPTIRHNPSQSVIASADVTSEKGNRLTIKIDYINHNRNRNRYLFILKIHNQL